MLWNTLIRRKFIEEHHISFTPSWLNHSEDLLFLIRCLHAGAVCVYLNKAFYHYISRDASLVTTRSLTALLSEKYVIEELDKMVDAKEYADFFKFKRYACLYIYEGRYWKEMKNLFPDIRCRLIGGAILTDIVSIPNWLVA